MDQTSRNRTDHQHPNTRIRRIAAAILASASTGLLLALPAQAEPLFPGGPEIAGIPAVVPDAPPGTTALTPFKAYGDLTPAIQPGGNAVVGGKQIIDITYKQPISDRAAAESSIVVTPSTEVAGHFNWVDDTHVQWLPDDYWPRGTTVNVSAAGATSSFKVSDTMTSVSDAAAHNFVVKIGNDVVKEFPASLGKKGHETPNGDYPVILKEKTVIMDSSTYGVPVDSKEGYKLEVWDAVRLTWSGVYVHAAPWSVDSQGNSNVSHGCINLSPENAAWFFDNVRVGDVVTVVNA
ncbi:L,D-transpeptidase [Skermania piniformis]|uniref:L,D-transpeptidase n=1 Tax=Skermania pinensis TaxID=39122 RepID=A0ABX8S9S5_9ACTN|nr:L,D-transpeptidase [Skermania piniformis]QXQ13742.1 L,D-transpeptidase [Skermania piniformis]